MGQRGGYRHTNSGKRKRIKRNRKKRKYCRGKEERRENERKKKEEKIKENSEGRRREDIIGNQDREETKG